MHMASRNRKALVLALAAGVVWLRYAKSAEGARRRLQGAGEKVCDVWTTIEERGRQVDSMVQEIIETGRELAAQAETVITNTLEKIEQTATIVHDNVTESSQEIASMIQDIRDAVGRLSHNPSRAA